MKFIDGLMIHSGDPVNDYVQFAVRHVLLRQGVLGIKVKIMLPYDPKEGKGVKKPLPDHISIVQPKEEAPITHPYSEPKEKKMEPLPQQMLHQQQLPPQQQQPQQQPPMQQQPPQGAPGNLMYG